MINSGFGWGISTLGRPELSLPEVLALLERYQLKYLEIRALEGRLDIANVLREADNFTTLREFARTGHVVSLDSGANISLPAMDLPELTTLAEIADECGIHYIRVFGGIDFQTPLSEEIIDITRQNLDAFGSLRSKCRLALETHDGYSSAARCVKLFDKLGRSMPVIWDVHHTYSTGESFEESLKLLQGLIVSLHVKDTDSCSGKSTVPGSGDLPVLELLRLLEDHSLSYPVMLEYEKLWEPELPPLETALDALNRYWR